MIEYYSIRNKKTSEEIKAFNTLEETLEFCDNNSISQTYYEIIKVVM